MTKQPLQIKNPLQELDYRDSELVVGLVCAVGTDYRPVAEAIKSTLAKYRYSAQFVKISELIEAVTDQPLLNSPETKRISTRMDAGNRACQDAGRHDIWALAAIAEISRRRADMLPEPRAAHVILTLKRPAEVGALRKVYNHGFLLVGVYATEQERLEYLIEKNAPKDDAIALIRRDAEELNLEYGQHTRDTFQLCDVFVQYKDGAYRAELERFFDLVFSNPYITPTQDEHGMFLAYASSLRSGQLSRQVGAALLSRRGDLLATGCNDVPKAGGGLYWPGRGDERDEVRGYDSNDVQRDKMVTQMTEILSEVDRDSLEIRSDRFRQVFSEFSAPGRLEDAVAAFRKQEEESAELRQRGTAPRFRGALDITEFGRAVHAEMDALLMCARSGVSPRGGTLYVTTFPCHNCTRHIIAAGIERVYYVEPYAKSRAEELHEDAIIVEDRVRKRIRQSGWRIPFRPFVGIGPRRYFDLFSLTLSSGYELIRKISGRTFPIDRENGIVRTGLSPNTYIQREAIAVEKLEVIPNQQLELDIELNGE